MRQTLRYVEIVGLIVLVLVLLAILDTKVTDHIYAWTAEYKSFLVMSVLIALSFVFGILHSINRLGVLARSRSYFGMILLVYGGAVFFFQPEYFQAFITADMGFWNKVSTYSLPAICVEGGLFTLFTEFLEHQRRTTQREYVLLSIAFLLYTVGSIAANFLVLNGAISSEHQILFARGIVLVVATIGVCVKVLHPKIITPSK